MNFIAIIFGSFFTLVAGAIIAHISMATPMGPWIAPAIVLIGGVILRLFRRNPNKINEDLILIQTAGAVGGSIAIGIGFTLPMLYFLNPEVFNGWLADPLHFCAIMAAVCMVAGALGIWLGRIFAHKLIVKEKLTFPVGDLIAKTITSQSQATQATQLFAGFSMATLLSLCRDGIGSIQGFIPRVFYLFPSYAGKELAFGFSPMLWAMGFITGMNIVFPLLVGMISRYVVLYPLNNHALYLPFSFFKPFATDQFAVAFCSGLMVTELIFTFVRFPKTLWDGIKKYSGFNYLHVLQNWRAAAHERQNGFTLTSNSKSIKLLLSFEPLLIMLGCYVFLRHFGFGLLSQAFIILLVIIFTYQISYFSGKTGLVPFGRFATFVMVPSMFLFGLNYVQITILCIFANICFGVATDLLFDYKAGEICEISHQKIYRYQWLGLIVTSMSIGFFMWLLLTHFSLGSADMFAHRARSRAVLIQSITFDIEPVILGFLFGFILRRFKLNPIMVFGGILMPTETTIGLMIGAMFSWLDKKAKDHVPFWSGVFTGESIWILGSLILKMCR